MTEFGPEIPLDGKRPDWLTDDNQIIAFEDDNGDWYGLGLSIWYARELDIERPRALRLPHDHAYYLATSKGFTYWPGGGSAPADYDNGEVMYRIGSVLPNARGLSWEHVPASTRFCPEYDIIGYRPKAVDKYGPPILVNGVIPDWLRDTDVGLFENSADRWFGQNGDSLLSWTWASDGPCPIRIRLPHDHPYYAATEKGFKYWPGGEKAPADWDGDAVLCRDGNTCPGYNVTDWGKVEGWHGAEIIGYRRTVTPVDDTVQVTGQRVTYTGTQTPSRIGQTGTITGNPDERDGGVWDDGALWCGYYRYNLTDIVEQDIDTVQVKRMTESEALELWGDLTKSIDSFDIDFLTGLKRLGIIKPEPTRLERFHASTDNPTIEAALEFER